jgi:hypothetical protein
MLQNQENYEPEYWSEKFSRSLYQELLSYGRISTSLLEAISNIPPEMQERVFEKGFKNFIETNNDIQMLEKIIKTEMLEDKIKNES